ncbi:MAG: hypothetical protein ACYC2O_10575 [Microthrixaceae bacterium]
MRVTTGGGANERTVEPDALANAVRPNTQGAGVVVTRVRHHGERVVQKTATGPSRVRLRREADLLEHLPMRERVELVAVFDVEDDLDDPGGGARTVMLTRDVGPATLARTTDLSDEDVLRALRRSAEALTRLHESGWCHGSVAPEHLVVGARGRIRLCSFGAAHPVDPQDPTATAGDLHGLLDIVDHVARRPSSSRSWRQRRRWGRTTRDLRRIAARARVPGRAPSDTLHRVQEEVAALQLEGPSSPRRATLLAAPTAFAVAAVVVVLASQLGDDVASPTRSTSQAQTSARSATPERPAPFVPFLTMSVDDGGAVVGDEGAAVAAMVEGNVVSIGDRDYRLGVAGDLAAVGDWNCDGVVTARLVRPGTGEVFEFRTWATDGAPIEAVLIGALPTPMAVRSVRTAPAPDGSSGSCDRLLVAPLDGALPELVVEPEEAIP